MLNCHVSTSVTYSIHDRSREALVKMEKFLKLKASQTSDTSSHQTKSKKEPHRKYDQSYLDLGFIADGGPEGEEVPQCLLCLEKLASASMKPSKLKRHLTTKHSAYVNKGRSYFLLKKEEYLRQQKLITGTASIPQKALRASFLAAYRIAKSKKPHTIGEELLLPACIDIVEEMLGKDAAVKIAKVPLSDNTVQRRTEEMSTDIREQTSEKIRNSAAFALQLDESTDVAKSAQLLAYVRYIDSTDIVEDFLFCEELKERTTGADIFDCLNGYITAEGFQWEKCVGLCTDGAAAMTGKKSGLLARVKEVAPLATFTHCFLHREALASKKLHPALHDVLQTAVKIVNAIKAGALSSRLFASLCREMGSEHQHLLLHSEVRWLSRGNVLTRLLELREEVSQFLSNVDSPLAVHLSDDEWCAKLAYLSDIFTHINELNKSMQGLSSSILTYTDKIAAFTSKLKLWRSRVEKGVWDMFPSLCVNDGERIRETVHTHLGALIQKFHEYFPDIGGKTFFVL